MLTTVTTLVVSEGFYVLPVTKGSDYCVMTFEISGERLTISSRPNNFLYGRSR